MVYTYQIREDRISDETGKEHIVYGIQAVDSAGHVVLAFPDVYFSRKKAERLVDLCNENQLELIHLADVVADAIQREAMVE